MTHEEFIRLKPEDGITLTDEDRKAVENTTEWQEMKAGDALEKAFPTPQWVYRLNGWLSRSPTFMCWCNSRLCKCIPYIFLGAWILCMLALLLKLAYGSS